MNTGSVQLFGGIGVSGMIYFGTPRSHRIRDIASYIVCERGDVDRILRHNLAVLFEVAL